VALEVVSVAIKSCQINVRSKSVSWKLYGRS